MKTVKTIFASLLMSVALVACQSTDSLISKYEEACQNGDAVKAAKVGEKLEKKELTPKQSLRLEAASMKLAEKVGPSVNFSF